MSSEASANQTLLFHRGTRPGFFPSDVLLTNGLSFSNRPIGNGQLCSKSKLGDRFLPSAARLFFALR
jgi:hypothetical protein